MRIINVITTEENVVDEIKSFGVVDEQFVDEVVEEAEKYYREKIKYFSKMTDEELDDVMPDHIEDGYWRDYTNGVTLTWSDIENVQI